MGQEKRKRQIEKEKARKDTWKIKVEVRKDTRKYGTGYK